MYPPPQISVNQILMYHPMRHRRYSYFYISSGTPFEETTCVKIYATSDSLYDMLAWCDEHLGDDFMCRIDVGSEVTLSARNIELGEVPMIFYFLNATNATAFSLWWGGGT